MIYLSLKLNKNLAIPQKLEEDVFKLSSSRAKIEKDEGLSSLQGQHFLIYENKEIIESILVSPLQNAGKIFRRYDKSTTSSKFSISSIIKPKGVLFHEDYRNFYE
jgi:hypothetical protein